MKDKLRELREQRQLTLKQVAKELGVTPSCYSNYEQGIREPSFDIFKKICLLFDVSSDYLLGLADF